MVDALTSETARALVERLYEEPATASDLATAVGTSVQNAQYHLDRSRLPRSSQSSTPGTPSAARR